MLVFLLVLVAAGGFAVIASIVMSRASNRSALWNAVLEGRENNWWKYILQFEKYLGRATCYVLVRRARSTW